MRTHKSMDEKDNNDKIIVPFRELYSVPNTSRVRTNLEPWGVSDDALSLVVPCL